MFHKNTAAIFLGEKKNYPFLKKKDIREKSVVWNNNKKQNAKTKNKRRMNTRKRNFKKKKKNLRTKI